MLYLTKPTVLPSAAKKPYALRMSQSIYGKSILKQKSNEVFEERDCEHCCGVAFPHVAKCLDLTAIASPRQGSLDERSLCSNYNSLS